MYNPHKRHSAGLGPLLKDAAVLGIVAVLAPSLQRKLFCKLRSLPKPPSKGSMCTQQRADSRAAS